MWLRETSADFIMTCMGPGKIGAGILAGIAAGAVAVNTADTHRFVIRDYEVRTAKVREKLTFVFVSDVHEKEYGKSNERLLLAIRAQKPDAVLVGGDMIIANAAMKDPGGHWMARPIAFLGALAQDYPVYLANGNHEDRMVTQNFTSDTPGGIEEHRVMYEVYMQKLYDLGVHGLHNTHAAFKDIVLWGLELDHSSYNKIFPWSLGVTEVEDTIGGKPDKEKFNLLLAHNPKYFEDYALWGADLTLSGHIHGGAVRIGNRGLLSPEIRFFPKYSGGEYHMYTAAGKRAEDHEMIVSCGLGTHTIPLRIFNPGDLDVIRIIPAKGRDGQNKEDKDEGKGREDVRG